MDIFREFSHIDHEWRKQKLQHIDDCLDPSVLENGTNDRLKNITKNLGRLIWFKLHRVHSEIFFVAVLYEFLSLLVLGVDWLLLVFLVPLALFFRLWFGKFLLNYLCI